MKNKNEIQFSFRIEQQKVRNRKYFVYEDKKYPIDFDLLVKNSNYFYKNREQYANIEYINLLNESDDEINIPEEAIEAFITSCQNEQCQISLSSILALQYLSYKYEYPEIISITENFCQEHNDEFIFESLFFKTKQRSTKEEKFFDTTKEEEIISSNLERYIKEKRMLNLPIPVLDRIIKGSKLNITKGIIEFLFEILEEKGEEGSILFNNIDFKHESIEVFKRLINEYSDKFDFNMINSTLLKTTTELTSELSKEREIYSEQFNEMKKTLEEERTKITRIEEEAEHRMKENEKRNEEHRIRYEQEIEHLKITNEERIRNIEERFEKIIKNYEEIISEFNIHKYQQITTEMMNIECFEQLNNELQNFIIDKIITNNEKQTNEEESNDLNQNEMKSHILFCNRLFNILSKSNENKPIFINNQEMRYKFIKEHLKKIDINIDIIEYLYSKNILHSYLIDLIKNYENITINLSFPSKSFEGILKILYDIKKEYSNKSNKSNKSKIIKIIIKFYSSINEINNSQQICQITKEIKEIDETIFQTFICNFFDKITKGLENNKSFIFMNCKWLNQITIPSYVTSIGNDAFNGCSSLTQVTIPSSVTSIGDRSFSECSSLLQMFIPSSCKSIGHYAFHNCKSLKQITIPVSLVSIGNSSFNRCKSLTQISIPSSVTSIGQNAFYGCSHLTEISIPSQINIQNLGIGSGVNIKRV